MKVSLYFSHGSGFVAWVIRGWTRSKFAHVAPVIDGRVYDAFWSTGVTCRPLAPSDAQAVRVDLPGTDTPLWNACWRTFLDLQIGRPYDKWGIVLDGLCKWFPAWIHVYDSRQGAWTCSRLCCVVAGEEAEAWGLRWPITPQDLYEFLTKS